MVNNFKEKNLKISSSMGSLNNHTCFDPFIYDPFEVLLYTTKMNITTLIYMSCKIFP